MTDAKIILLIGRSGRGKSALANVVTGTNSFKESSASVSETKKIQLGEFAENYLNYQIIDTPGIGDTKMSDSEVLDIIAEAVYRTKDGVGQVFFITNGRFDQYEMATYDLLRTILFDSDITRHTTIVRTNFKRFEKPDKCEKNTDEMIREAREKRAELEQNISTKEKELASLSSTEIRYQELSAEIEKVKKELAATNLAEILESCERRIVYVDNPSLEDEEKLEINKNKRNKSREILLKHLFKNCQGEPYKPEKLKELSEEIADDYSQYLNKKAEFQKELEEEIKRLNSRTSQASAVPQDSSSQVSSVKTELTIEENPTLIEEEVLIIEKKERDKIIAQLQDKKEKLKKEIAEKEKIIHQKVLKHIFNNYEAINKELGGDIFLNSVAGKHPWPEIHPEFANKELIVKWLSQGFDYEQTQNWARALIDFNPQIDAGFCAWLRDTKKLTVERIKRASYPQNIERWRQEYVAYLGKETELLDKYDERLNQGKDWTDIHPDFSEYQKVWEKAGFTHSETQEWITVGFEPKDYEEVQAWKSLNFASQAAKSWIVIGLKPHEHEFATYLKLKGHQPNPDLNLEQLREEFETWKEELKPAQEYLDFHYPKSQRKEITELYIEKKNLVDTLDLRDFINLEWLNVSHNEKLNDLNLKKCNKLQTLYCCNCDLSDLDLSDCSELNFLECQVNQLNNLKLNPESKTHTLNAHDNKFTDLSFLNALNPKELKILILCNNNFQEQNLSFFSKFINLEGLDLGNYHREKSIKKRVQQGIYNKFFGSLEPLKGCTKLGNLNISGTDIDSGLEYLPNSIGWIKCSVEERPDAKVKTIYNLFADKRGIVKTEYDDKLDYKIIKSFPQKLEVYKQKLLVKKQVEHILAAEEIISDQLNQQLTKNNYLTDFANTWQKYLETAQTLEEVSLRQEQILTIVKNLKSEVVGERQAQIQVPPKS